MRKRNVIIVCVALIVLFASSYIFASLGQGSWKIEGFDSLFPSLGTWKSDGIEYELTQDRKGYKVCGFSGNGKKIKIPDEYQGLPVLEVNAEAFWDSKITAVRIPESVNTLYNSFSGCEYLKKIVVDGNNPKYHSAGNCIIETETKTLVSGCAASKIPEDGSVTCIGGKAFYACMKLTSIRIPRSVTKIEPRAFYWCYRLAEVCNCSGIKLTAGSDNDGNVAEYALNVYTPWEGKSYLYTKRGCLFYDDGERAYLVDYKGKKSNLKLPDIGKPYMINGFALCGNTEITKVSIPDCVTSIGEYAFSSCRNLTSVKMPENLTLIGEYAFSGCENVTSIRIPKNVTDIANNAFENCVRLVEVCNCSSIELRYPWNVFRYVHNYYTLESGESKLSTAKDGSVLYTDGTDTYLVAYRGKNKNPDLNTLGKDLKLRNYVFYNRADLVGVTLPDNLLEIPLYAFEGCTGLTEVIISESVREIGARAFYKCKSLTKVTIPENVEEISSSVFAECEKLEKIKFENPNGWHAGNNSEAFNLTDETVAARFFTDMFCREVWERKK